MPSADIEVESLEYTLGVENNNPASLSLIANQKYDEDAFLSNSFIRSEKWHFYNILNDDWLLEDESNNDNLLTLRKNVTSSHISIPRGEVSILLEHKILS